jgi:hypothetical protein
LFKCLVNAFCLAICFWVEGRGEVGFNAKLLKDPPPKFGAVDRGMVTDDGVRKPMETDYLLDDHLDVFRCVATFTGRYKVCFFGEMVNPNVNTVIAITRGQFDDGVHCNVSPWPVGSWVGAKVAKWSVAIRFGTLAEVTGVNVVGDILAEARPGIILSD